MRYAVATGKSRSCHGETSLIHRPSTIVLVPSSSSSVRNSLHLHSPSPKPPRGQGCKRRWSSMLEERSMILLRPTLSLLPFDNKSPTLSALSAGVAFGWRRSRLAWLHQRLLVASRLQQYHLTPLCPSPGPFTESSEEPIAPRHDNSP